MLPRLALALALVLTALPVCAEELRKLDLDVSKLGTRITEDDGTIRITTRWPTTICLGEVEGPAIEAATLLYQARVKSGLDEGAAFLELWAHVGGGQYFSRGMNDQVTGTTDWKTISTPFRFEKGQSPDRVTLNLVINGKGTVWVDEVVLSKEPLP